MLALEAEGYDAEDAVAALANLISVQSYESVDQIGEAIERECELTPNAGSVKRRSFD